MRNVSAVLKQNHRAGIRDAEVCGGEEQNLMFLILGWLYAIHGHDPIIVLNAMLLQSLLPIFQDFLLCQSHPGKVCVIGLHYICIYM